MSKKKFVIGFKKIYQLWEYAKLIKANNIEIITTSMVLICDCSDADIELLSEYGGEVIEEFTPEHYPYTINQNLINGTN